MFARQSKIPDIALVIPCDNDEENAPAIARSEQLERAGDSFDIIAIDTCSQDRTVEVVRSLSASAPHRHGVER